VQPRGSRTTGPEPTASVAYSKITIPYVEVMCVIETPEPLEFCLNRVFADADKPVLTTDRASASPDQDRFCHRKTEDAVQNACRRSGPLSSMATTP
jgi:hypothetical protein